MFIKSFLKISYFILIFISFVIVSVSDMTLYQMANVHFYLLFFILMVDVLQSRSITLLSVWIVGFVYIILSEMILYRHSTIFYDWTYRFILLSNDFVLLGYQFFKTDSQKNVRNDIITLDKHRTLFNVLLVIMYLLYMYFKIPETINAYYLGGRNVTSEDYNIFFSQFLSTYKYFPLLLGFYMVRILHKNKWLVLLISLPIFAMVLLSGTRFKLLFSLLPFLLICGFFRFDKFSIKNIVATLIFASFFVFVGSFMKEIRGTSFEDAKTKELFVIENRATHGDDFSMEICKHGSPEGCVNMVRNIRQYVMDNDYTYGMSTGFVFYFWIPRFLWNNKPLMLNYWLPRLYMDKLNENHSTSSSFCGEPYADFGYFSYILMFLIGGGVKIGTNFLKKYNWGTASNYNSIFAVLLIPYVFFAVRSPVTATMTILIEVLFMYICKKLFFKSN